MATDTEIILNRSTKRFLIACAVVHAWSGQGAKPSEIAEVAVEQADALLAELDKAK